MSESLCSFSLAAQGAYSRDAVPPAPCAAGPAIPPGSIQDVGEEKGRSGLYSSTKSCGSISLRNGHDEAPDARQGFEGEKPSQEVFPPQSRPDLPFSGPTSFVRLPVRGGCETLVDADIAEALGRRTLRLWQGYPAVRFSNRSIRLHQLVSGTALGGQVDHINGDKLDNRRCNLRIADRSLNQTNRHTAVRAASGFRGVYATGCDGRWGSVLKWHGHLHHHSSWRERVIAALARDDLVRRVTGFEAGLNFPRAMPRAEAAAVLRTWALSPVTVWFVKRSNGAIRRLVCRAAQGVPAQRLARDARQNVVTITDIDVAGFRCIPLEAILCLTYKNESFRVTDARPTEKGESGRDAPLARV
ncbi:MAG: HNH endonuclease [Phycisphaerae bacterium]|nr:HNH endonuclease [Phycisphaerae bacterium]